MTTRDDESYKQQTIKPPSGGLGLWPRIKGAESLSARRVLLISLPVVLLGGVLTFFILTWSGAISGSIRSRDESPRSQNGPTRSPDALTTTSGVLALSNLQAQIEGLQARADAGFGSVEERAGLIELVTLRGRILGHIADYQLAEEQADKLVREFPAVGLAFIARAQARSTFHRFKEALADFDKAERLGVPSETVDSERSGIFQALGRYDEALALCNKAVERRRDFYSLGALAALHAEMGDIARAEHLFAETRSQYRGVSPIPLALLDFQHGQMWMSQGDLRQSRSWFEESIRRLPGYAQAQGHLAEVEAALGEPDSAIARLRPLTISSDDPDYAGHLARILSEVGRVGEAREWRDHAAERYDELVARHLEAFADHAAEFWLEVGGDPDRALFLAKRNLQVRQTPRAHELVTRATLACDGAADSPRS